MANTWSGFNGSVNATEDALRSALQGSNAPTVRGYSMHLVTANTAGTRSVNISAGTSWAHGVRAVLDAGAVTLDPVTVTGQSRWDAVVIRRDWNVSSDKVKYEKVNGVAAANAPRVVPADVRTTIGDVYDQVLALVQVSFGATVPTAVEDMRLRSHEVLFAPNLAALPSLTTDTTFYGAEAVLPDGSRYRCLLDASGNRAWLPAGNGMLELTGSGVLSSEAGFSGTNMPIRGLYSPTSGEVQIDFVIRRSSSAAIPTNASGIFLPNTLVAMVKEPFRPNQTVPVVGQYAGGAGFDWAPFTAGLAPDGRFLLQSGAPGLDLRLRAPSGPNGTVAPSDISLRASIRFTRKV